MSQQLVLKARGIVTHPNALSATPEGSLAEALNVVIDRNEVIEPRRGFFQYGNTFGLPSDLTKQLIQYKDTVIRHVLNKIQFDSDYQGQFLDFNGTETIDEVENGIRLKYIEANGNLYMATAEGVKKLSARNQTDFFYEQVQQAGGVKALDITATSDYSSEGFLSANSKVAYKVVWGIKDLNENLILGSPSARAVVYNSTASSCIVQLNFAVPADVTNTNYFYQVYRTAVFSETPPTEPVDPGQEFYLVFEDQVTSLQITNGEVSVSDITPEDFRKSGTLLYTNPVSGEGIAQANEKPPFGQDIALYKGYTFLANTKTVQRLNLSFLSVTGLTSGSSTISVLDGTNTNVYTFRGTVETYTNDFTGSGLTDFYNATPGPAEYFTLNAATQYSGIDGTQYYVWYYRSVNDEDPLLTGKIGIKVDISAAANVTDIMNSTQTQILNDTTDFNVSINGNIMTIVCSNNGYVDSGPGSTISSINLTKDGLGTGEDSANNFIFLPRVPTGSENGPTTSQQLEQVARSLVKVLNKQDNIVYAYYISGFDDVPGQISLEQQDVVGPAFYLNSNAGSQFTPALPTSGSSIISSDEVRPNRIYYSKYQQPEAFPLANYIDIGPKDREIKRIIPLRDSLFIFKEDGIYRLSGDNAPFTVAPFDFSAQVLAGDTAVVLNNQIYALSTQGVIVVTDTGVSVISRPIENQLLKIIREGYSYKTASFGVSYESDRSYFLWTVTNVTDTVATQCFRYNTFTNSWTRFDTSKSCGLVNFGDDKMYLGAGDLNFIEKERKSLTRIDHTDREYLKDVLLNGVNGKQIRINDATDIVVGDVLLQRQYVTANQFNRILDKLDRDAQVSDANYESTLSISAGQDMRSSLEALANKLDLDPGIADTDYATSIGNYSYTVTNITDATQTVLTIGAHNILANRWINITNSDCVPSIDGTYQVVAVGANTVTLNRSVEIAGTTANIQTAVDYSPDYQACYNIITNKLNNDTGVQYTNFPVISGYTDYEAAVLSLNKNTGIVNLTVDQELLHGDITLYKAIRCIVIWNPQTFGDPSVDKQVREGTVMFENKNFTLVELSYSTDRSPSFVGTQLRGQGIGDFGQFGFGGLNFGGVAAPIPLRTYIPKDKQRCRFMNVKFEHMVAMEKFSIFGISLTFRPYNIRTTR